MKYDDSERGADDGKMSVRLFDEDVVIVEVTQGVRTFHLEMSEWNARRVLASLSLLLDLPLSPKVAKKIQMGGTPR